MRECSHQNIKVDTTQLHLARTNIILIIYTDMIPVVPAVARCISLVRIDYIISLAKTVVLLIWEHFTEWLDKHSN